MTFLISQNKVATADRRDGQIYTLLISNLLRIS